MAVLYCRRLGHGSTVLLLWQGLQTELKNVVYGCHCAALVCLCAASPADVGVMIVLHLSVRHTCVMVVLHLSVRHTCVMVLLHLLVPLHLCHGSTAFVGPLIALVCVCAEHSRAP